MGTILRGIAAAIIVVVFWTSNASAQVDRATLSGIVKDSGGAALPGVPWW
jgi:hypothetical protein